MFLHPYQFNSAYPTLYFKYSLLTHWNTLSNLDTCEPCTFIGHMLQSPIHPRKIMKQSTSHEQLFNFVLSRIIPVTSHWCLWEYYFFPATHNWILINGTKLDSLTLWVTNKHWIFFDILKHFWNKCSSCSQSRTQVHLFCQMGQKRKHTRENSTHSWIYIFWTVYLWTKYTDWRKRRHWVNRWVS